jgi:hypothetical protein
VNKVRLYPRLITAAMVFVCSLTATPARSFPTTMYHVAVDTSNMPGPGGNPSTIVFQYNPNYFGIGDMSDASTAIISNFKFTGGAGTGFAGPSSDFGAAAGDLSTGPGAMLIISNTDPTGNNEVDQPFNFFGTSSVQFDLTLTMPVLDGADAGEVMPEPQTAPPLDFSLFGLSFFAMDGSSPSPPATDPVSGTALRIRHFDSGQNDIIVNGGQNIVTVPEPSTLTIMCMAGAGLAYVRRRRRGRRF